MKLNRIACTCANGYGI